MSRKQVYKLKGFNDSVLKIDDKYPTITKSAKMLANKTKILAKMNERKKEIEREEKERQELVNDENDDGEEM